jgi:hypothetical protein
MWVPGNLVCSVSLDYGDLLREDLAVVRRQWLIDHPSSSGRSNWRSGGQGRDLDSPGCRFSDRSELEASVNVLAGPDAERSSELTAGP